MQRLLRDRRYTSSPKNMLAVLLRQRKNPYLCTDTMLRLARSCSMSIRCGTVSSIVLLLFPSANLTNKLQKKALRNNNQSVCWEFAQSSTNIVLPLRHLRAHSFIRPLYVNKLFTNCISTYYLHCNYISS